jgi:hypothetical protein
MGRGATGYNKGCNHLLGQHYSDIQNIHDGNASFVSFIDYLVGRQNGYYYLSTFPSKYEGKKQNTKTIHYLNLLQGRITKGSH